MGTDNSNVAIFLGRKNTAQESKEIEDAVVKHRSCGTDGVIRKRCELGIVTKDLWMTFQVSLCTSVISFNSSIIIYLHLSKFSSSRLHLPSSCKLVLSFLLLLLLVFGFSLLIWVGVKIDALIIEVLCRCLNCNYKSSISVVG